MIPMHEYGSGKLEIYLPTRPALEVTIIYTVNDREPGKFSYIQKSRNGELSRFGPNPENTNAASIFYAMAKVWSAPLGLHLQTTKFDAVVKISSRFPQADWLMEQSKLAGNYDISHRFSKSGNARSGEAAPISELATECRYKSEGDEGTFKTILIVDESIHSGNSVAVIIGLLLDAGVNSNCNFTVACHWWGMHDPAASEA